MRPLLRGAQNGQPITRSSARFRFDGVSRAALRGMVWGDARRDPRHRRHGDLAGLPSRADPDAGSLRPAAWHCLCLPLDLVPPRADTRMEASSSPLHPTKPKVGLRTTRPNEVWHIDPTVIRLLDGSRAYLHAVIDNFSRRTLAWHVAGAFAAGNSVTVLLAASEGAASSGRVPVVLADAGVEDVMRSRPVAAVGMRPRGHGPGRSPCFCLRVAMYASIGRAATAVREASEQYPASASTCVGVSPDWPSRRPGGQQRCSNLAIETAVTLGLMFRLPLRQTEGFVWSIVTRRSRGGGRC